MTVSDAAWERIAREPGRAARLLPLDARLEGAVDRRGQVPVHALGLGALRRRGVGRRAARGGPRGVDRAPRALGRGLPRRRPRDGPRALAAQRRDRRGLRDGDRGARGAHRRAGAGALPRALRRDDLRRPGRRQPRPDRAHGARRPAGSTRSSAWPRSAGRSPTSAPTSRSAPASRPRWPRCRRPKPAIAMIFDSHMHVGSFESMFGVSLDRDGIDRLMREHEIIERRRLLSRTTHTCARWSSRSPACTRSPGGTRACPATSRRSTRAPRPSEVPRAEAASADRRLSSRTTRPSTR